MVVYLTNGTVCSRRLLVLDWYMEEFNMLRGKVIFTGMVIVLCICIFTPCFGSGQGGAPASTGVSKNLNLTGLPILKEKETFTILSQRHQFSQNNMTEKECVKRAERETNIIINWNEILTASWGERMNIVFASNDLPDAIIRMPQNLFLENLNQLTDLTGMIDTYIPVLSDFYKRNPGHKAIQTTPDGRIYSLPSGVSSFLNSFNDCLFVNTAWLKTLNLAVPKTTEEFYNVLKKFKENDLNNNGNKNDEIPFGFCQADGGATLRSMFGSWGILDNGDHLQVINGKVIFTPTRPEYYEALKYFNRLYSEGLMDEEGFSQSGAQFQAKGRSNPTLFGSFVHKILPNIVGYDKMNDYSPISPLKGPTGIQLWNRSRSMGGVITGFVISKKCANPEALARWYDYLHSSFEIVQEWDNGPVNVTWETANVNGKMMWRTIEKHVPAGTSWGELRHTLGVGGAGITYAEIYDTNNKNFRIYDDINTRVQIEALEVVEAFLIKDVIPVGLEAPDVIRERAILSTDIETYLKTFISTSVMNGINDARWNEHLKNVERLNIAKYVQSYQALYDRMK